jgi:tellurite resistance protein TehA-like permease
MARPLPPPANDAGFVPMPSTLAPSASSRRDWLRDRIATLYPGYFALVMATGIIANAMFFEGERAISDVLLAINVTAYAVLILMTLARVVCFPGAVWRDLTEPQLVFAFFTLVAATDVVGVGLSLRGFAMVALAMWIGALIVWLLLIYLSFTVLIVFNAPSRGDIIFGGWLIAIVATEAIAINAVVVAPTLDALSLSTSSLGAAAPLILVFAHMLWGVGVMFYVIFIVLFAQRIFLSHVSPQDLTPTLWVVMGAAAISVNAGTLLIASDPPLAFLQAMRPFVDGVTMIMWAWATWWIPLLVGFGIWTHGVHRRPLTYTPLFWSLVFPLGMYSLASLRLSRVADIAALLALSRVMVWVALAAWLLTSAGLAAVCWRHLRQAAVADRAAG